MLLRSFRMWAQRRQGGTAVAIRPSEELKAIDLLSMSHARKILTVRRQIKQGTYDLESRLDEILERVLQDLSAKQ